MILIKKFAWVHTEIMILIGMTLIVIKAGFSFVKSLSIQKNDKKTGCLCVVKKKPHNMIHDKVFQNNWFLCLIILET